MKVTNNAQGPRGFNVMRELPDGSAAPEMVLLQPGESVDDVELTDANDRVFLGMVKTRDLLVEGATKAFQKTADATPEPQVQPVKPAADTREAVDPAKMDDRQVQNTKNKTPGV